MPARAISVRFITVSDKNEILRGGLPEIIFGTLGYHFWCILGALFGRMFDNFGGPSV